MNDDPGHLYIDEPATTPAEVLVSVVVPAYNVEAYIDQCLSSIENQSYGALEIIVVDDGSIDNTLELVRAHAEVDGRIRVLAQQNQFAGVARNVGFEQSSGEYVLFLDADDFFAPDMVASLVARAEETRSDVVVCRSDYYDDASGEERPIDFSLLHVDANDVYSGEELCDVMFRFCVGWPWDKLYRSAFVREQGLRFQALRSTNDAFFVFMALMLSERISFVDMPLVKHRTNNATSLEHTRSKSWNNAVIAALAIGEELRARGLYSTFERSYLNWFLNFSLWNVETLDAASRLALVDCLRSELAALLPSAPADDFYFCDKERRAAELLLAPESSLLCCGLQLGVALSTLENDKRWYEERHEENLFEISWRNEEIEHLRCRIAQTEAERDRAEQANQELRDSLTYRVGRLIMCIPCAIKDALTGRGVSNATDAAHDSDASSNVEDGASAADSSAAEDSSVQMASSGCDYSADTEQACWDETVHEQVEEEQLL